MFFGMFLHVPVFDLIEPEVQGRFLRDLCQVIVDEIVGVRGEGESGGLD